MLEIKMEFFLKSIDWSTKLIGIAALMLLVACEPPPPETHEITGSTMGTTYSIKVIRPGFDVKAASHEITDRLLELNQVFSTYLPASEISRINSNPAEIMVVSEEFMSLLKLSQTVYELTEHAFDVTVGPLVNLWGFGPDGPRDGIPDPEAISEARARTGFSRLNFSERALERPAGIYIDFSAIAKGYAVDEIAALLEARDVQRYMVEIGGEVRARGRNAMGKPWQIGLEAPDRHERRLQRVMPLRDMGMATSGDYRNYFEYQGTAYSHTIDPATGWPVKHHMASVTVLHPSTGYADALATGFSVLGVERTMAIADEQDLAVLAIIRDDDSCEREYCEVLSESMKQYLGAHD